MKNHRDDYMEYKDGAITYFKEEDRSGDLIKLYENSKDLNKRMRITAIINQKDSRKTVFLNSLEEFEKLKDEIEEKASEDSKKSKNVEVIDKKDDEKEINIEDTDDDDTGDEENKEKDIKEEIDELEEKAKVMEAAGDALKGDMDSLNKLKKSMMKESVDLGIIMEARAKYEQAQDNMDMTTAYYMVDKNILTAKREAIILDINRAIGCGEDVEPLQDVLVGLNNQIENLDSNYELVFSDLQKEVTNAHAELKEASKEVTKKVSADFRNSYKQVRNYSEDGILESESTDLTKNLNRVVLNTSYDDSIVSNGKLPATSQQTININGQVVRVVSTEHEGGVESSYLDGNTEQMRTEAGEQEYVTRDENGSLIADYPELEDALERIGIENVNDIEEACEAIDEKAARGDDRENDGDYPDPSLTPEN